MSKIRGQAPISVPGRIGLVIVGTVQVVFAFLAFWDLAHRSADEVRGPRCVGSLPAEPVAAP